MISFHIKWIVPSILLFCMTWYIRNDAFNLQPEDLTASISTGDMYLVVDLSGGINATSYPVSTLLAEPEGGWTNDYKSTKLVMRRIEAGTFMMGSSDEEPGWRSDEPLHKVTLTKPYYIGVFEVTQKQWELVMGAHASDTQGDTRPVERISYDMIRGTVKGAQWPAYTGVDHRSFMRKVKDCFLGDVTKEIIEMGSINVEDAIAVDGTSFMGKLRAKTALGFDLPTEAQWEYACRAGTTTMYNVGTDQMDQLGLREEGAAKGNGGSIVGSYLPNGWGIYDMHGSVKEWCLDWWQSAVGRSPGIDPVGASSGTYRLLRGGCWNATAQFCRSAARSGEYPSCRYADGEYAESMRYNGLRVTVRLEQ